MQRSCRLRSLGSAKPAKKTKIPAEAVWHSEPEKADKADQKARSIARAKPGETPAFRPVQLATLVDTVPAGADWLFEMKYDGYRTLVAVGGGEARAYTRSGLDWSGRFPSILSDARKLKVRSALIDGEAVVLDPEGRSNFQKLQGALKGAPASIDYFAFDLLEQPVPADDDEGLAALAGAIPICADEALHTRDHLDRLAGRYSHVNVKLDKTGGLTEALAMRDAAVDAGFEIMVGCMVGSSLAMAPAVLVAQGAMVTDLDGPLLLAQDRDEPLKFDEAGVHPPTPGLWG